MQDAIKFPATVDEPPMMLLWRGDELVPFFILFIIGFMMKQVLISIIAGWLLVKVVRKYRDIKPDGYLTHLLWWRGILPLFTRTTSNPFTRQYVLHRYIEND